MEGGSLAEAMARRRQTVDEILRVGREIAAALAHAHAHGVVHRDVKPDTSGLTSDGCAAARVAQELTRIADGAADAPAREEPARPRGRPLRALVEPLARGRAA